jgi:excinuclease ABC subunit C
MPEINENINDYDDSQVRHSLIGKLKNLPTNPGVYQFMNEAGKIIYVGKAINLRSRVRSYFQQNRPVDAKTKALMVKIADVEIIVTDSEAEALILEDTLIKKLKPRYNILLRDDKTYPFIRVTNEQYPRVYITRKIIRDGSRYFGPFTEVSNLRRLVKTIRTLFFLRSCELNITTQSIEKKKFKVCLDYHIKKCEGPCEGLVSEEAYNDGVKSAIQVIIGKTHDLEKSIEAKMNELSELMEFEKAALLRNKLTVLREFTTSQKVATIDLIDRDIVGLARIDELSCAVILKVRDGKLIGKRQFIISNSIGKSDEELIQTVLEKWYLESEIVPKEIFLPALPEQADFINDWLRQKRGKSLEMTVPKLGDKKKLVTMANINAEYLLRDYQIALVKKEQTASRAVLSLQRDLRLEKPPLRIECFDNSHIQGSDYVSSLVVFIDGKPKKSDYRKFKIKSFVGNDDFAAMREVVGRRYSRLIEEKASFPDLIIIDGGKGQLSSAMEVLTKLGINNQVTVIGLAKRLEEVFFPGESDAVLLPRTSSSLKLIQHIRDEAHRFAINYHRQLREKRTLQTELTKIDGIGEKTAQNLLIKFGSFEGIRNASNESLVAETGEKLAAKIMDYFNTNES